MMSKNYVIGLLSGTSVDAIDAGLWSFDASGAQLVSRLEAPIGPKIKKHILSLSVHGKCTLKELGQLDTAMANLFANAANALIKKSKVPKNQILAIGSHGQTLWHEPSIELPFTMQIGDPNIIAQKTQIPVIADFRRADIALGGQGAPLAPAFHHWAFKDSTVDRMIVNIGGIANISFLPKDPSLPYLGYDTGPGNCLMDQWCLEHRSKAYDHNGDFANQGKSNNALLNALLEDPYFKKGPPKSTGKESFNLDWLKTYLHQSPDIKAADVQATLLSLTSRTIVNAIKQHVNRSQVYICGGGSHNNRLMAQLKKDLGTSYELNSLEKLGMSPDWVESGCFAWLALQRLQNKPVEISQVTGAKRNTLLGASYFPDPTTFETLLQSKTS